MNIISTSNTLIVIMLRIFSSIFIEGQNILLRRQKSIIISLFFFENFKSFIQMPSLSLQVQLQLKCETLIYVSTLFQTESIHSMQITVTRCLGIPLNNHFFHEIAHGITLAQVKISIVQEFHCHQIVRVVFENLVPFDTCLL